VDAITVVVDAVAIVVVGGETGDVGDTSIMSEAKADETQVIADGGEEAPAAGTPIAIVAVVGGGTRDT
jgi:hypothetical protein